MNQTQDFKLIAIEGNIGVGKSTLLPKLADRLSNLDDRPWRLIIEEVDTDPEFQRLLKAFTNDPSQRINFQRYITNKRAETCQDLDPGFNYIIERSLFSDLVFCQANLAEACRPDGKDLDYYYDIQDKLEDYPQVSAVVYLKSDPIVSYERMLSRGRDAEVGTPQSYIQLISDCHNTFLPHICDKYNTQLLTVDWTHFGCPEGLAEQVIEVCQVLNAD
ncbi:MULTISPECIES: deoxynucleoside kinase [Ferrimonas]|uniref:deoxynucleoside kinase n=1 Tax=Ferrimonas TaxID=44011 RepID=UPI0004174063|nr:MULTISPECIES: deoxynucleoside kinase [Ferrimonas]USD39448.1 deoxynucleoside kinase [Ferrimonas sp. SCSIO 43195]